MIKTISVKSSTTLILPDSEYEEIKRILKKFNLQKTLDGTLWSIPTGIIGQIVTDNLKIIIEPSIDYLCTNDYLRLLIPDGKFIKDPDGANDFSNSQISASILSAFISKLDLVISHGLPRKYIWESKESNYIEGKVDFVTSFERILENQKPSFKGESEVLRIDYFEMRLLKFAYEKTILLNSKYRNNSISTALSGISQSKFSISPDFQAKKDLYSKDLYDALIYAQLIINSLNITHHKNNYSISMLINGNKIFEDFVFSLLTSSFKNEKFLPQEVLEVATNKKKSIISKPDILYTGAHKVVMDVKNKNFNKSITSSNFHQLLSYMVTFKIKTGALIYPYSCPDIESEMYTIINQSEKKIYAIPLDIKTNNYDSFINQIEQITRFN